MHTALLALLIAAAPAAPVPAPATATTTADAPQQRGRDAALAASVSALAAVAGVWVGTTVGNAALDSYCSGGCDPVAASISGASGEQQLQWHAAVGAAVTLL